MNFIDRITGKDMTRQLAEMKARAATLPADYQAAFTEIQAQLWPHSDLTGRNLMPLMENVLDLLEETAGEHLALDEVFGDDISSFVAALTDEHTAYDYREKARRQLNRNVAKKVGLR